MAWRYFLEDEPATAYQRAHQSLMRLRVGDPVLCAERLDGRDRGWRRDDSLFRQWYLGSDYDYVEVDADRASEVMREWLGSGRITHLSDESQSDRPDEATIAAWNAAEAQIRERYAQVSPPPGAEDIQPPRTDNP